MICFMAHISEKNQKGVQAMAMHDWNHDGKEDMVDNFIEYQIRRLQRAVCRKENLLNVSRS